MIFMVCAILFAGAAVSAQETTDTLVVVVKHDNSGNTYFEKLGKPFKDGYKAVETGVVSGYKVVETTFVNGYKAVEDAFVQPFKDTVSTGLMYTKRYRADIELSWSNPATWGITSSHGYSFGNGLYVGGGAGFAAEFTKNDDSENSWTHTYLVPVFADIKYCLINMKATPFISMKAGGYADITNSGLRTFVNPALGLDLGRFAIKVGYEYQLGFWGHGNGESTHQIKCSVGFVF